MKRYRFSHLVAALGVAALSLGAVACGDDDDDGGLPDASTVDAASVDAEPGIDAAVVPNTRSATLAVSEITTPQIIVDGNGNVASGGSISLAFSDITGDDIVAPVYDDRNGGSEGCAVVSYDLAGGEAPPPRTDEGAITISGANQPIPNPCTFNDDTGLYACVTASGALAGGDSFSPNGDDPNDPGDESLSATVTIAGETFNADDDLGTFITLTGFTNPAYNGSFPIVNVPVADGNVAVVAFPAPLGPGDAEVLAAAGTYAQTIGNGPTPARVDFITQGDQITVEKTTDSDIEPFDATVSVGGEGFVLDEDSDDVTNIPSDGSEMTFSCSGDGGTCGNATITTVLGRATNADLDGASIFEMPTGTKLVTFSCAFFGTNAATVPADAMAEIWQDDITKVETRVFRFNLTQFGNADGTNLVNLVAGHGYIGWTLAPEK